MSSQESPVDVRGTEELLDDDDEAVLLTLEAEDGVDEPPDPPQATRKLLIAKTSVSWEFFIGYISFVITYFLPYTNFLFNYRCLFRQRFFSFR